MDLPNKNMKVYKTMKSLKRFSLIFCIFCFYLQNAYSQIGYQVALLNTATGKPRAGETVNVTIEIGDKKSHLIWRETQTATSNDFGILSLTVGNENTFKNANWTNLPFFIAVWVDNVLIGRTQILSVPVAETAKGGAPAFPIEDLLGTWTKEDAYVTFKEDGTFTGTMERNHGNYSGYYNISGNIIYIFYAKEFGESSNSHGLCLFKDGKFKGGTFNGYTK